jgi:transcription elongation GreA/GreB family factor
MKKEDIVIACRSLLTERIEMYKNNLELLKESGEDEAKSSAGDKFETAREMLRQDEEKLEMQLVQLEKYQSDMSVLAKKSLSPTIGRGSVAITDQGTYYIAAPLGKVSFNQQVFFAISADSPMGSALLAKKAGERINVNGREINILEVL